MYVRTYICIRMWQHCAPTYIRTYSTICAATLPHFRVCANHSGQPRRVGQACKNSGIQRTMETHNPVLVCVTYMLEIHISVSHTQNEHTYVGGERHHDDLATGRYHLIGKNCCIASMNWAHILPPVITWKVSRWETGVMCRATHHKLRRHKIGEIQACRKKLWGATVCNDTCTHEKNVSGITFRYTYVRMYVA